MAVELVFQSPVLTGYPLGLVFGEELGPGDQLAELTLVATLPGLRGTLQVRRIVNVSAALALPGLGASLAVAYLSNTARPTVGRSRERWQEGDNGTVGAEVRNQQAVTLRTNRETSRWQLGVAAANGVRNILPNRLVRTPADRTAWHAEALRARQGAGSAFADAVRLRYSRSSQFEEALRAHLSGKALHQDGIRMRDSTRARHQVSVPVSVLMRGGRLQAARPLALYRESAYQQAWPPRAGIYVPELPPVHEPCYVPGLPVDFLFHEPFSSNANLVFRCGPYIPPVAPADPIVIPVRRVYYVDNNVTLRRVDNGLVLKAQSFNLSLDVDSWTWSFSAAMPARHLDDIQRGTVLETVVNGQAVRVLAEGFSRQRTFDDATLTVSGRGISAQLGSPFAPVLNFDSSPGLTAQQLANKVLTLNGQPIGWTVDWQMADWVVPSAAWTFQGSYMDALTDIAAAVGGYVHPHPTTQTLKFMKRYPVLPWDWAATAPDFELPADAVVVEGIDWETKPLYNKAFVTGMGTGGVLVEATRAGTAGDLDAPMEAHALITHVDAGRARAEAILSDVGEQAAVRLRTPIFSDSGLILPGKLVKYVDGGVTRYGLSRAIQIEAGHEESWQTVEVETHA